MEYIYDGSHYAGYEEEKLFGYTNGISVWAVFNELETKYFFQVRLNDEVVKEMDRVTVAEVYVEGMEKFANTKGIHFESDARDDLPTDVQALHEEIKYLRSEKDKAQKLAAKMVKGVMKDKGKENEMAITKILQKHVAEI